MRTIDFLTDWKNGNNGIYTGVIWYLALMIGMVYDNELMYKRVTGVRSTHWESTYRSSK